MLQKSKQEYPKNCPFCRIILPIINRIRATWCNNCGASWVPKCPRCGNPSWMSLDRKYKHTIKTKCK